MNGFIGTLAAQLALQPVSPAADGIAPRPSRDHAPVGCEPAADDPRAPGRPRVNAPRTQRMARANAPPVLQVGGAHQCPSRAPPSRPHADAPALSSRRCPPPQLGTAASRGWALAGYGGNEHAVPCVAEGWLC